MPSYIPEYVYGALHDDNGRWTGKSGLVPWPAHLKPRDQAADVELTKKGEAYCASNVPLPDIDLFELFGEEPKTVSDLPALAEARGVFFLTLSNDRATLAYTVERLIAMLDQMDGDENLEETGDDEPSLGWPTLGMHQLDVGGVIFPGIRLDDDREQDNADSEHGGDDEPTLGWEKGSMPYDQTHIAIYGMDEVEEENEHGGDVQDQLHDACDEGNDEPFLGWSEHQSLHGCVATGDEFPHAGRGYAAFDGDGTVAARKVLRTLQSVRPDVRQNYVGGFCTGSYAALKVDGLTITAGKDRESCDPDKLTIIRPGVAMVGGF